MNLLLDTHVLLWWLANDERLGAKARRAISSRDDLVVASSASIWEIAIKRAAGKLDAPGDLLDVIGGEGFEALAITFEHAMEAGALPRHHADPFDRMLVAQARIERLVIVTADRRLSRYEVETMTAA